MAIIEDLTPEFLAQVDQIVQAHCKDIREISYVEHGSDNLVVMVNHQFVFRFPRHTAGVARLTFETALLQKLHSRLKSIATPKLTTVHNLPLYVIAEYIQGEPLTIEQIMALTEDEQTAFGRTLAEFMVELHASISGLEVARLRHEALLDNLDEPWPVYFNRLFVRQPLPNERLRPLVDEHYTAWRQYTAAAKDQYAIHDDLHPVNLLFVGPKLSGILDFGDTNLGTVEEEMRWLYSMGDLVLGAAIQRYQELTGKKIDQQHVRLWAIMHELAIFTDRLNQDKTNDPSFVRAQTNLQKWVNLPTVL
jgi:aminoglycoside 2''-phosphotransferase